MEAPNYFHIQKVYLMFVYNFQIIYIPAHKNCNVFEISIKIVVWFFKNNQINIHKLSIYQFYQLPQFVKSVYCVRRL